MSKSDRQSRGGTRTGGGTAATAGEGLRIVVDNREQEPYLFQGYEATATRGTLATGDYSLQGLTDLVAVERKELGDLMGCLTHDRERFTRELERLRGFEAAALVVESSFLEIAGGHYRSKMNPESAVQSLVAIMERFRLPVFFADSRQGGEYFTFHFLRHYARRVVARYQAVTR